MTFQKLPTDYLRPEHRLRSLLFGEGVSTQDGLLKGEKDRLAVADELNMMLGATAATAVEIKRQAKEIERLLEEMRAISEMPHKFGSGDCETNDNPDCPACTATVALSPPSRRKPMTLTPEQEHEMRVFAEEMPDEYGPMFGRDVVNVLKELDALRARVAALEKLTISQAEELDDYGEQIAALEEAGDWLAVHMERIRHMEELNRRAHGRPPRPVEKIAALAGARWREVRDSGADSGGSRPSHSASGTLAGVSVEELYKPL